MTKKACKELAEMIKSNKPRAEHLCGSEYGKGLYSSWVGFAEDLANFCEKNSAKFDRVKFMKIAGRDS